MLINKLMTKRIKMFIHSRFLFTTDFFVDFLVLSFLSCF